MTPHSRYHICCMGPGGNGHGCGFLCAVQTKSDMLEAAQLRAPKHPGEVIETFDSMAMHCQIDTWRVDAEGYVRPVHRRAGRARP